jgi:hypothetical protein
MDQFGLPTSGLFEQYVFNANSATSGANWHTWTKPLGKSMASIMLIGAGGGGGTGVVGANSTAAGGGGGGSGGMTIIEIPLVLLPPRLYISVGQAKSGIAVNTLNTYISTQPNTTANHIFAIANSGGAGGNAAGATAGAAGTGATAATAAGMPLGWAWAKLALAGQAGIIGGTTVAGGALTLPLTGLRVTGGTGGGGLPAAAAAGTAGGAFNTVSVVSYFPVPAGGAGPAAATTPAGVGNHGTLISEAGFYYYGGTGGSSTHGTATGAGLVQAAGGNGGIGSGGGGMGGALTGSTAAVAALGGPGLVVITCY